MRTSLIVMCSLAFIASSAPAMSQYGGGDGCERNRHGELVCAPGAVPGLRYGRDGCARDRDGSLICRPGARPGGRHRGRDRGDDDFGGGDGCERDSRGRLVCLPRARPGRPYYGR